jgi:hypothetical protein
MHVVRAAEISISFFRVYSLPRGDCGSPLKLPRTVKVGNPAVFLPDTAFLHWGSRRKKSPSILSEPACAVVLK